MTVQYLLVLFLITRDVRMENVFSMNGEIDSIISFPCEIDQLPANAVITWVYRPEVPSIHGIQWLPLYANGRRLTQSNERFIVDYHGYNDRTNKSSSILTIHHLQPSDEGLYKCRSNQYQSIPLIFNLTISPAMVILPQDGIIHVNPHDYSLNLSCTIRELPTEKINPFKLKWYHNNREITSQYLKKKFFFNENQATLILFLDHHLPKHSDIFKCIYENGKASKHVRILSSTSSVMDYSKSTARQTRTISSYFLCVSTLLFFLINNH